MIKCLDSDFLNSQFENGDEIYLPEYKGKIDLEFLDYIGSGIFHEYKKYLKFLKL